LFSFEDAIYKNHNNNLIKHTKDLSVLEKMAKFNSKDSEHFFIN
jgi:hypothetical protein